MKRVSLSLVLLAGLAGCGRSAANSTPFTIDLPAQENELFDARMESPNDLLKRFYQDSKILVLETSNHTTFKRYAMIEELLRSLGAEAPRYLVLERFHDNNTFYRDLSVSKLADLNLATYFETIGAKTASLCDASEWAYSISEFMPEIEELNKSLTKKVQVTSIDGMSDAQIASWPWNGDPSTMSQFHLTQGDCSYKSGNPDFKFIPLLVTSGTREDLTETNFEQLYKSLGQDDKMILVYHHAHTINSLESCMPFMDPADEKSWVSKKEPLAWLARFLAKHPQARSEMKMVLLDEKDPEFNRDGVLKFSARQAARHTGASFAIDLAGFKGVLPETGLASFMDTAYLQTYHGGQHVSTETVPDFFDGIVYSSDAETKYLLKDSHTYLPDMCAAGAN